MLRDAFGELAGERLRVRGEKLIERPAGHVPLVGGKDRFAALV